MSLETVAPTWRNKLNVDETFVFGGDIAANPSAPSSWSSGAFSIQRACALAPTDWIELDFTFDAKSAGHGIAIGLSPFDTNKAESSIQSSWRWDTSGSLLVYEMGSFVTNIGATVLPMSCRIVYSAGQIKYYSNAGADTLRATSSRTTAVVYDEMFVGLCIDVSFYGTSGKLHATLKAGTSSTPEIPMDGSTGRLGIATYEANGVLAGGY